MDVSWATTQLAGEDSESSVGGCGHVRRRAQLPCDIRGDRTKVGGMIAFPLVMVVVDGERYLVSMLGDNVNWVHNVRAANGRAILRSGECKDIQLEEVSARQRAAILKAYLQRAPGARPHFPVNKDAALVEFQKIAAAYPVFRVVSNKTA
jgi:hypothetical protein